MRCAPCDIFAGFVADTGGVDDHDLGFELVRLARRGDPTIKTAGSQALPAPASDREITMSAFVTEAIPPDEQGNEVPDEGQCDAEAYDVSLDVTVTSLRD